MMPGRAWCGSLTRWPIVLGLGLALLVLPLSAQDGPAGAVEGVWKGVLVAGERRIPLAFHIRAKEGGLEATWDSPSQGAKGLATTRLSYVEGLLTIEIALVHGSFEGRLSADGSTIAGRWRQGGAELPLELRRDLDFAAPSRPQHPRPPFPYISEELAIEGGAPGVLLAATLLIPEGEGPFPAVVLVTGSGPQDRDETILEHKPFLVIADFLARRGIAVLRYDDRGVAASTGDYQAATTLDFAADAQAALAVLGRRPRIDPAKTGIVGHSEGAIVADIVASRDPAAAFIVLLAGPGLRGEELLYLQGEALARASGASRAEIERAMAVNRSLYAAALAPGEGAAAEASVRKAYLAYVDGEGELSGAEREAELRQTETVVASLANPWMRSFLALDPAPYLAALAIPVLAMGGTKDLQVPVDENLAAIRAAIGPRARLSTLRFEGLNHLFQHAKTGLPSEYGTIEESFAPEALEALAAWILAR
jgi:fermentation-respiration switch protein FrsA (DUF1100 family)